MSTSNYRKVVWYMKGRKEYTKSGFLAASKLFTAGDVDVNCSGRSYMITGANSGIGKETALEIAKRGGCVHLVCRSKERGEAAVAEIKGATGNEDVHLHLLDMSNPRGVATFADEFAKSDKPLHVLVNNAGCMVNTREVTEDGLEKNFATNTLGTHILTSLLVPKLSNHDDPRVVIVSSGGMLVMKLDVSDLQHEKGTFDGTFVYAQHKRQQVIMTEQYAKMYPKIHFSSMHPGWADTPAVQSSMPDFREKMKDNLRTPGQGADTIVWLSISPSVKKQPSGLFFQDRVPAPTHLPLAWSKSSPADDQKLMDKLQDFMQQFHP